eukprot:TRINITY_DN7829_c0_g3_i1.p12 TRINITY_DN7829_c0_g3~~TRINITY_DN7829_c0_g3_i1.p12  ORF type:complete len:114 (+),score=5.42 TRINITY_DN7829_c0_g3_i1:3785-4126(+)
MRDLLKTKENNTYSCKPNKMLNFKQITQIFKKQDQDNKILYYSIKFLQICTQNQVDFLFFRVKIKCNRILQHFLAFQNFMKMGAFFSTAVSTQKRKSAKFVKNDSKQQFFMQT